jgi:hypothetical protein
MAARLGAREGVRFAPPERRNVTQQPMDWQSVRAQLRADALAFVKATPSSDEASATILEVINELANEASEPADADFYRVRVPTLIAARLRARRLTEWAAAFENRSAPAEQAESSRYAVDMLIGKAAGLLCGASPGERQFCFVRHLREAITFESVDFVEAAEPVLKSDPGAIRALAAMLHERIAVYPDDPALLAYTPARNLRRASSAQTREMRFIDVWDDPFERTLLWLYDFDAYELLRRVDYHAYLYLLEDFPVRGGVYLLLDAADGSATAQELCLLLRNARLVFNSDGEWIKQNRVAFVLLNLLAGRLLLQPIEDGQPSETFKETLAAIIDALMGRPDSVPLSYAWLQRVLMSPGKSRRRAAMKDDDDLATALVLVAANLAPHLSPHPEPLKWIEEEFYVWRNWRVYALLAIELSRQPVDKGRITDLLASVLLNDLASSVGIDRLGTGGNIERRIIANAIAQIPDPADWFASLWKRLFWQRDRFRGYHHRDAARPNIGQVAVLWAICGLEQLDVSDEARSLWLALYDAVHESILTEAFRQHNDAWSIALRFLAALWLKIFPNEAPAGTPGSLAALIGPWKRIDINFAQLVEVLDRFGVQPEQLRQTGVSGDLLRKIIAESRVMGRTLLIEQEISAINAVAEKLNSIQK